jgi:hypothetical protein
MISKVLWKDKSKDKLTFSLAIQICHHHFTSLMSNRPITAVLDIDVGRSMKDHYELGRGVRGPKADVLLEALDAICRVLPAGSKVSMNLSGRPHAKVRDFLALLTHLHNECGRLGVFPQLKGGPDYRDPLIRLCEFNGAKGIGRFLRSDRFLSDKMCEFVYHLAKSDNAWLLALIASLPPMVKSRWLSRGGRAVRWMFGPNSSYARMEDEQAEETVKTAFRAAFRQHLVRLIDSAPADQPRRVCDAKHILTILNGFRRRIPSLARGNAQSCRNEYMLDGLGKYIYDSIPMRQSLPHFDEIFSRNNDRKNTKILIKISDGQSENGDPVGTIRRLTANHRDSGKVWVVTCLITDSKHCCGKKLFGSEDPRVSPLRAARELFQISSKIRVDLPVFDVLREQGWTIPDSGECRLFLCTDNQTHICEFLEHIPSILRTDDVQAHVIRRVEIERFFGERIDRFGVDNQDRTRICLLWSISTVLHTVLAGIRRNPLSFDEVWQSVAVEAQNTNHHPHNHQRRRILSMIQALALRFPVTAKPVNESTARLAIQENRPSVVTMCLSRNQFKRFQSFFLDPATRTTIMTRADLGPPPNPHVKQQRIVHVLTLIGASPDCLTFFYPEQPDRWGDDGYVKIENHADFNMRFVTVCGDPKRFTNDDRQFIESQRIQVVNSPKA